MEISETDKFGTTGTPFLKTPYACQRSGFWGTPRSYLLGENYLGFAPTNKVVGLVASTVQDLYARLIDSVVQKLQAQNHYSSHGHVEDVNMTNQIK